MTTKLRFGFCAAALTALFALNPGCECDGDPAAGQGDGGDAGIGVIGDGFITDVDGNVVTLYDGGIVITTDAGTFTCYQTVCNGKLLACGNCLDDDGDGLVDPQDRECLGPCDNTEGPELNGGIGGESGGPCKADCYFDFGNGPGNDDCHWDHRCDPLAVAPNYPPEGPGCGFEQKLVGGKDCPATQSTQCKDFCSPLTPNGCDCFGCCTFPELATAGAGGSPGYVWIGALDSANVGTCTFAKVTDQTACPPCTPVADCFNDCGECELCIGKTTLPDHCTQPIPDGGIVTDGGTVYTPPPRCPGATQPCGLPTDPACQAGFYCISGCCQPTDIIL